MHTRLKVRSTAFRRQTRTLARLRLWLGATLLAVGQEARAEDLVWRPVQAPSTPVITLGRPELVSQNVQTTSMTVRAQAGEMPLTPPPPPPPGASPFGAPAPGYAGSAGADAYNCGIITNNDSGVGGFFSRFCEGTKKCWEGFTGAATSPFQPGAAGRSNFQSDHAFDVFASPVSNPFFFEDPRSLTEARPYFIYQRTPSNNPVYAGGNNFFAGVRGSLAITDRFSITIDELGITSSRPEGGTPGFDHTTGLSEIHAGPKFTFLRNDSGSSPTVGAVGLIFEIPVGSSGAFQNTGNLGLAPYLSLAHNFFPSSYGSFNVMSTTGYAFGLDDQRSDFAYSSLHLDYDVGNFKRFYPLIELNYAHYTSNGNQQPINFEGRDLFNFGSTNVSGLNELTVAVGARVNLSQNIQFGLAPEFGLLNRDRTLDRFRVTADLIFRY